MTKEEMKAALQDELKSFKENLSDYASKEDLQKKFTEFESKLEDLNMTDKLKDLTDAVEKQGLALNKLNSDRQPAKTLRDQLWEVKDALKNAANKNVVIKTDVTRSSITNSTISMRLPNVGQLATQANRLAPLFAQASVGSGMGGVVRYIDQTTVTNAAAAVTEGAEKPESAITWAEYTLALQKVAHNIPVTEEALEDIDFMESEINNMLLKYLEIKVDNYLWNATGTAPQIKGIYTSADTYTASAAGITDASLFDLIVKVGEDISGDTMYSPNYAVMNIADVNEMILKKDANNNYVRPPFVSDGTVLTVNGVTVVASNSVTANTMLVGDFNFATLYRKGGVRLEVGRIANQFIENQVTVQAEVYLGLLVRNAHTDAFRKVTDIDAALVTLAS
jgi:HK97 family phage major capsid protein